VAVGAEDKIEVERGGESGKTGRQAKAATGRLRKSFLKFWILGWVKYNDVNNKLWPFSDDPVLEKSRYFVIDKIIRLNKFSFKN
jgi:hypothetical protein